MLLKDYVKQQNLTQRAMADKLGITISHVRMIMFGTGLPSRKLSIKIEEVTNGMVSKEEAIFNEERKDNTQPKEGNEG